MAMNNNHAAAVSYYSNNYNSNPYLNMLQQQRRVVRQSSSQTTSKKQLKQAASTAGLTDVLPKPNTDNVNDPTDAADGDNSSNNNEGKSYAWWERVMERPADDTQQQHTQHGSAAIPANRRSHDATYYVDDDTGKEYMIISGGFTDEEFDLFPVWALDLSYQANASDPIEAGHDVALWHLLEAGYHDDDTDADAVDNVNVNANATIVADVDGNGTGTVDADGNDNDTATKIRSVPSSRIGHISGVDHKTGTLYIFGGIHYNKKPDSAGSARNNDYWTEDKVSIWSAPISDVLNGDGEKLSWTKRTEFNTTKTASLPVSRGESGGGVWKEENALVFYGGLHTSELGEIGEPLGDVWVYYFDNHTFEELAPHPSADTWKSGSGGKESSVPQPRVSHAASVVGDKLYVFGGMGQYESSADTYDMFNEPSLQWLTLSDVWEFDLRKRTWSQRHMTPRLARAYHSIVVLEDETLISYGGYRQSQIYTGQAVAYVFSAVLISNKNGGNWLKVNNPPDQPNDEGAGFRFDHTSVADSNGNMITWGGRFREVRQVSGVWKFETSFVSSQQLEKAKPDELELYEAELQSLHFIIVIVMFSGIFIIAVYSTLRWHSLQRGGGGAGIFIPSNGASQDLIDSLPTKTYGGNQTTNSDDEARESPHTFNPEAPDDLYHAEDCPICLVEYEQGDLLRCLPCGHDFHTECVDHWLRSNSTCPQCRQEINVDTDSRTSAAAQRRQFWRNPWSYFSYDDNGRIIENTASLRESPTRSSRGRFNLLPSRAHSDASSADLELTPSLESAGRGNDRTHNQIGVQTSSNEVFVA
eukprot:CAMPEP_0196815678 /NCGR_PEP_ID=MMETSP1362-20130617/51192_1 /TAXON_ID=163516 /ORGANISM="Leptocylindrus danicus, Strain CCMP1856" /LENGTH=812 /DNA_ID=CAMNT_0042192725 /DNA_START=150 /DNA_END=2588 /DNA_ORIENTATION=-